MKYCTAYTLIRKLNEFKENLKGIDIVKADKKRDGAYTIALEQLDAVLDSRMDMEEIQ
jgi:inactivated superfamily I helicase